MQPCIEIAALEAASKGRDQRETMCDVSRGIRSTDLGRCALLLADKSTVLVVIPVTKLRA